MSNLPPYVKIASLENQIEISRAAADSNRETINTQKINLSLALRTGNQEEINKWETLLAGSESAQARYESELSSARSELNALRNQNTTSSSSNQTGAESITGGARNLGSENQFKKPDGTNVENGAGDPSMPTGTATVDEGEEPGATIEIENGEVSEQRTDPNSTYVSPRSKLANLVENPLEQFSSYNALWTLAVLTPEQFNTPSTYRTSDLSFASDFTMNDQTGEIEESSIIFSSGGRGDQYRTKTFYGSPEFYLDNFTMKATVSASEKTGNSNAVMFEFTIIEPYSMGLLLTSLQTAAIKAGYANYLDNTPYLLRLDIKGWKDGATQLSSVKPKYFVLKFTKINFTVNESGSTYTVMAIPYNHSAYGDTTNILFQDIAIEPGPEGTVEELLSELCEMLNRNEERLKQEGRIGTEDKYVIQFPNKSSDFIRSSSDNDAGSASKSTKEVKGRAVAGTNAQVITDFDVNPIGKSRFGFDQGVGGNYSFKRENDVYDPNTGRILRDKMSIDPKKRTFHFTQSQTLTDIITQCILSSNYAIAALDPNKMENGFIKWFKLDVQIEFLKFDSLTGTYARKITFRVVPFKVHHSIFANPNTPSIGLDKLQKKIVKSYEYIYTGQNTDILNFDIKIQNLFYTGSHSGPEADTPSVRNQNLAGIAETPGKKTPIVVGADPRAQAGNLGSGRIRKVIKKTGMYGGADAKITEQRVAEAFHEAFISGSSADLVNLDLEILGDTYWMVDSGFANYFSPESTITDQITEDGTCNYEGSDVYIMITFRTPADIDPVTGMYQFSTKGKESPFSGIYRVTRLENTFYEGVFKQRLTCIRMRGQSSDYDGEERITSKATGGLIDTKEPEVPKINMVPTELITGTSLA